VSKLPIRPAKSIIRGVGPRDKRPFSSFDDLAAWLVQLGRASDVQDVRNNLRALWGDILFSWYTQGQVGCVFAQRLARDVAGSNWYTAVMEGDWQAEHVTGVCDAAASVRAEALQVLFPCEATVEDALVIIKRLAEHPRWQCTDTGWLEGESGDSLQVGLRWISSGGDYESWVLGIAPFDSMPFTRRFVGAPFIALVLRPSPPEQSRAPVPAGTSGLPASHLAHMDDGLGGDIEKRTKWNAGTRMAKRALVSPDPMSRARAKVTFAFPAWAKAELAGLLT
jgi:hypothetical protein